MRNIGLAEIWICALLFYAVSALIPAMKQGFNDKFTSTRQQLTNTIYQNSRDQNNIKINMSTLWSHPLAIQRKMNDVPTIIRTSKHTIILDNLELWVFQEEKFEYKTTLKSLSDYKVQFVKGFDWHDRLFLLVCFQNSVCNLYSAASNFDVTYHQPISDNGDPTDAQFFVQQEKLFLAILFHERSVSVRLNRISSQLRIYQWQNFYMDMELIPDITPTATCITLFKYEEDIVFVLGCPENDAIRFPSQVWSRKPNGEISLVQYLPTDKPTSIKHFMERGENFIFILENDRDETSIYWWEGSEFVRWLSVEGMEKYFQVAVSSNLKYPTFLTFTHKNVLRICLMTSVKLEKIYETIFSSGYITENVSILSVTAFEENDKSYMLVLSKSESQLYISLHHVNVQIMITSASEFPHFEELRSDSIQEALETIQKGVTSLKFKMENLESLSSSVLLTNKDASISHGVVTEEIQVDSGEIHNEIHLRRDIAQFMVDLYTNYVEPLSQEVNTTWRKLQTTPMEKNRSLIFQGDVYIKEAKLNSLSAHLINNNVFEPRSFLSAMNPISQRLKNVKAKKLKVEWLVVKKLGDKNIEDFHFADSRVRVPLSVAGLEARNLNLSEDKTINNLSAKNLEDKTVTVETEDDAFNKISQIGDEKIPARPKILKLRDNTVIQNLHVDFINDTPLERTLTSIFVSGIDNVIYGNVHFQAGVRTREMIAGKFDFPEKQSDVNSSPQMNVAPSQTNTYPPQIIIPQPQVNFPLPQSYIPPPQLSYPPPPMNIYPQFRPHISLYRPYPPQARPLPQYWTPFNPFILEGRRMKRKTVREDESIIRKRKIKVIGDLKVARLLFKNSSLEVKNNFVPTDDLGKIFWTKNTPQEINGSVHFTQGISIGGDLSSPVVNGKNLSCFASTRSNFSSLIFENIIVDGNLTTEAYNLSWTPENEPQSSVLKVLNVRHLNVEKINGEPFENILQTSSLQGKGIKIITGNLKVDGNVEAKYINEIDVKQKFNSALFIDSDFKLKNVEFENISGTNIKVKCLNNHSSESLKRLTSEENPYVFIHGDIHVSNLSNVKFINNHSANFEKVVNKKQGAVIYGKKKFNAQVVVSKELKIKNINQINIDKRLNDFLRVSEEQEVTGFYTFRTVEMKSNFNVDSINGAVVSNFAFTDQKQLKLQSNVQFKSLAVDGNLTSSSLHKTCYLPKAESDVSFGQSSKWSSVDIAGDISWPDLGGDELQHLLESAVTSQSNQTITGNVTIKLLSVPKIRVGSLNDKNITFVFQDALSREKENQIISGKKTFLKPFKCKKIEVKGDAQLKLINDININDIDQRIVRHHGDGKEVVTGNKTFINGFKAFSLECPEGINGVKAENIVSRKFSSEAPPFTVQHLKVFGPLLVEKVNDLNLKDFIQDCIYLNNTDTQRITGQLHIKGNVSLKGNVTTPSINNISMSDIVYVTNKKKPTRIHGCKRLMSDMEIESDPNIDILNNRNVVDTYRDNVKIDQNVTINGSVIFESAVEMDTIFAKEYYVDEEKLIYLNKTFSP